ncbi:collagen alpha-1(X) chain-like [Mugil cephalus]|uniref:collagen alpha-1(X) chain-like n=1 Tax=Mugil cephalus TaxID=48193 RepID=UPI001FB57B14|nr:collagen alpha-1(X) chain-like [Mugil cephalus]
MSSLFATVTVLCITTLAIVSPVEMNPRLAEPRQQGSAVLFFATCQGELREILFNPVIFNQVLVNQGSGYNNQTGIFTAPLAGIYQFVFAAQLCRGELNNHWSFVVNYKELMACHAQVSGGATVINTCYFMAELQENDKVWIKQRAGSCAWASSRSKTINFSGILLASEGASMLGEKYGSGYSCPIPSFNHNMNTLTDNADQSFALSSMSLLVSLALTLCM